MSRSLFALPVAIIIAACSSSTADHPAVVRTHPTGDTIQALPLASRPYGVAVAGNVALVTQLDGQSVARFTLRPFAYTATIPVGSTPTGISANSAGTLALVTNQFDPSFGVIDVGAGRQTATFTAPTTTFRTIFSSNGSVAFGTVTNGTLDVFDMAHGRLSGQVPIVVNGNGLAFGKGDTLLYVSSMSGDISVVNTRTLSTVRNVTLGGTLQDVAVSGDSTELFVAHEEAPEIDALPLPLPANLTIRGNIAPPTPVFGLAVTPDGKQLWATSTSGNIYVIDLASDSVKLTIPTAGTPRRIAFDATGAVAIVSDESGYVYEIR